MKLSVAMITYNQERFIAQAIESVLAQNVNFEYEVVIGEDCSTDSTRSIVIDFQRRFPDRIIPQLRERNLGALRNLAATLAACRGEYVAFLEGDDYWSSPDKLQKQVDVLDAHSDCAISCHRVKFLNESGSAQHVVYPLLPAGPHTIENLLQGNFIVTCSVVVRRQLIPQQFPPWFFKMKMGDWPLFAMTARHGKIELMDEVMAAYRVHSAGIWNSLPAAVRHHESARMLKSLNRQFGFAYTSTIRRTIALPYLDLADAARSSGNRLETAKHLVSYVRSGGLRLSSSPRILAGLLAYILIGSGYKLFSRAGSAASSRQ